MPNRKHCVWLVWVRSSILNENICFNSMLLKFLKNGIINFTPKVDSFTKHFRHIVAKISIDYFLSIYIEHIYMCVWEWLIFLWKISSSIILLSHPQWFQKHSLKFLMKILIFTDHSTGYKQHIAVLLDMFLRSSRFLLLSNSHISKTIKPIQEYAVK